MSVSVCLCSESAEGSEPRGASEEEDERAGVVAAVALPHHPLLHPQQARKGALPVPVSLACNAQAAPLDGDMLSMSPGSFNCTVGLSVRP